MARRYSATDVLQMWDSESEDEFDRYIDENYESRENEVETVTDDCWRELLKRPTNMLVILLNQTSCHPIKGFVDGNRAAWKKILASIIVMSVEAKTRIIHNNNNNNNNNYHNHLLHTGFLGVY